MDDLFSASDLGLRYVPKCSLTHLTSDELFVIDRIGSAIEGLATGRLEPQNSTQEHLKRVALWHAVPKYHEEWIWLRYMVLIKYLPIPATTCNLTRSFFPLRSALACPRHEALCAHICCYASEPRKAVQIISEHASRHRHAWTPPRVDFLFKSITQARGLSQNPGHQVSLPLFENEVYSIDDPLKRMSLRASVTRNHGCLEGFTDSPDDLGPGYWDGTARTTWED